MALLVSLGAVLPVSAQSYIDQEELERVLNRRTENLDEIPEVYYEYYVLYSSRDNSVLARNNLYHFIGEGDVEKGKERAKLVNLINRKLIQNMQVGDTIVVPTQFDLDLRAYSPFPRYYPGARDFDKLFIIDKTQQAFAAYQNGKLERWGIVNTGNPKETPTPNGRYNFNWKTEFRVSSLSPPGEPWEMRWVFNFHNERGMHVHQYPMPTGGPTSHGCVRLVDADAQWIYGWADSWVTGAGSGVGSMGVTIPKKPGTTVLVIGSEPEAHPSPFEFKKRYPVLTRADLPAHPYDVPAGTPQQKYFDRVRAQRASR